MKKKITNWFIKTVWPFILKLLIRYAEEIVRFIVHKIKKIIKDYQLNKRKAYDKEISDKEVELSETSNESIKARLRNEIKELNLKRDAYIESLDDINEIIKDAEDKLITDVHNNTKDLKAEDFINKQNNQLELDESKQLFLENDVETQK
ncbi:hypothetical protein [Tenuibacillus multivorans]|uniref:Uncharacterized protein n=1 Tax=Tenuibacillus multivorans TaxID=237069 RepID=A0A1G9XRN3_9BACI|nr:hypothetical protein [Tenuibacillus multivorans]GEL75770.1 hypothetical protein TMU01_00050 [Tenuibacillus multivorans]SDM98903.1 hypothetical protein SAMN05216498_1064 [Tenuibacillus multivorans]